LEDLRPLTLDHGLGRVGRLARDASLEAFALRVRERLGLDRVRVVGRPDLPVSRVAVCTGSGGSLLPDFMACDAQVYVSGDLRYHDAREAEVQDRGLIDVGHFGAERLAIELLCRRMGRELQDRGLEATVEPCRLEKEPFADY
jgi:putative NIF3 family GTP cyclohydrolase 1 type 2